MTVLLEKAENQENVKVQKPEVGDALHLCFDSECIKHVLLAYYYIINIFLLLDLLDRLMEKQLEIVSNPHETVGKFQKRTAVTQFEFVSSLPCATESTCFA